MSSIFDKVITYLPKLMILWNTEIPAYMYIMWIKEFHVDAWRVSINNFKFHSCHPWPKSHDICYTHLCTKSKLFSFCRGYYIHNNHTRTPLCFYTGKLVVNKLSHKF